MRFALEGVTVLDLSHALAGPFCTMMLADHGADVIKLEPPGGGDIARAWGSRGPSGDAGYFIGLHRNKRGIVVDLKNPRGKEVFLRLVERSDVQAVEALAVVAEAAVAFELARAALDKLGGDALVDVCAAYDAYLGRIGERWRPRT